MSYAMQQYLGGNGEALAAMRDTSRNVGAVYAVRLVDDRAQRASSGTARSTRGTITSPIEDCGVRASVIAVKPSERDSLTFRATASHREVAPGAEEFLPSVDRAVASAAANLRARLARRVPSRTPRPGGVGRRAHMARKHPYRCQSVPPARRRSGRDALRSSRSPMYRPASVTIRSVLPATSTPPAGASASAGSWTITFARQSTTRRPTPSGGAGQRIVMRSAPLHRPCCVVTIGYTM